MLEAFEPVDSGGWTRPTRYNGASNLKQTKEVNMSTRTFANAIVAVALAVPAAAALAAQPYGRDTVYAVADAVTTPASTAASSDAQVYGRDTVHASRIAGSGQSLSREAGLTLKPGRA
jgi:hypothetical protein